MHTYLDQPAHLYLGRDRATAFAQGPRTFPTAAAAIRFAIEDAAPVSLRGAQLRCADQAWSARQLRDVYDSPGFPRSMRYANN